MGELLSVFRQLPTQGLKLLGLWADPRRPTSRAADWPMRSQGRPRPGEPRWGPCSIASLPCSQAGR